MMITEARPLVLRGGGAGSFGDKAERGVGRRAGRSGRPVGARGRVSAWFSAWRPGFLWWNRPKRGRADCGAHGLLCVGSRLCLCLSVPGLGSLTWPRRGATGRGPWPAAAGAARVFGCLLH